MARVARAAKPSATGEAAPLAATRPAAQPPRRRIILLFDGTWNDVAFGDRDTSILRLREMIDIALRDPSRPEQDKTYVFYRRGVGTDGALDRIRGGMFGIGVAENVRRGYRFLARHYRPDDDIFVFGFSRGAFTARSLVGYLGAAGLLRDAWCTPERERAAWAYYRTPPDDRLPGDWHALGPYVHPRETLRVRALGVFDTVGALGVPAGLFRWANRQRYEFHNVEMPSITDLNLHAVAIDEQRGPFVPALWRRHKFKRLVPEPQTEQVWFPGVHADIGGGYHDGEQRQAGEPALDNLALDWMLRRLKARFACFPAPAGLVDPAPDSRWALAAQHDSFAFPYSVGRRAHRAIANGVFAVPAGDMLVGRDRHEALAGEALHVSALDRLGRLVPCAGRMVCYAPLPLRDALRRVESNQPGPRADALPVVGWNGEPMADAAAVRALVDAARARLAAAGLPD
jgi:uncharacterized protein (DUF2235 family)